MSSRPGTASPRRGLHMPIIATLVAFLTFAGGSAAYGLWTAATTLTLAASAADVGIVQDGHDDDAHGIDDLTFTYSEADDLFATSGAITIQNTGSREAWYRLVLAPDPSVPNLPGAIDVVVGAVGSVEDCLISADLDDEVTGPLSATPPASAPPFAPFVYDSETLDLQLGAGESIVLCVTTTLPEEDFAPFGSTNVEIEITASLKYAEGEAWTVSGEPVTVTQNVITEDLWLLFAYPIGRYWVDQAYVDNNDQVHSYGRVCMDGSIERPARFTGLMTCADTWDGQWRLVPVPGSETQEWWILRAINAFNQPTTPRWTFTGMNNPITNNAPDDNNPNQRWILEGRGDGTYRIVASTADDGNGNPVCLTNGGAANAANSLLIVPATCSDASQYQGFTFELNGVPLPSVVRDEQGDPVYPNGYPLTCGGTGPTNRTLSWPQSTEYQGEVQYRLMFSGNQATTHGNGHATSIASGNSQTWIQGWWGSYGGNQLTNAVTAVVEQQITSLGTWIPITEPRPLWIVHIGTNDNRIYCSEPNMLPPSDVLTCGGADIYNRALTWAVNSEFANWDEFRVLFNGIVATTGLTAGSANAANNQGWIQTWWAANGGGQFTNNVSVTVEQRITALGSWTQITQPLAISFLHFGTNDNRVYCGSPPSPLPMTPTFTCTNGPDNWYYWAVTHGGDNGLVIPEYRAIAWYRVKMGADVFGTQMSGHSYGITLTPQSNQTFYAAHQGSQSLTVEYSLDAGASWQTFATKTVTVANPGGNPAGYRVMSGC